MRSTPSPGRRGQEIRRNSIIAIASDRHCQSNYGLPQSSNGKIVRFRPSQMERKRLRLAEILGRIPSLRTSQRLAIDHRRSYRPRISRRAKYPFRPQGQYGSIQQITASYIGRRRYYVDSPSSRIRRMDCSPDTAQTIRRT